MDTLLGWTSAKMNRRYGSGHTVATLKEAVEAFNTEPVKELTAIREAIEAKARKALKIGLR